MKYQFICYPRCTTCQKAEQWLKEHGIAYEVRNIKEQNPTVAELQEWHKSGLPLRKFFNTSGQLSAPGAKGQTTGDVRGGTARCWLPTACWSSVRSYLPLTGFWWGLRDADWANVLDKHRKI